MSTAKEKMREKKLRHQPISVQFSSCSAQNGDEAVSERPKRQKRERASGEYMKDMPKIILAGAFARARAAEVSSMLKAVSKTTGSCHVFESLPKHMRRRAMSHNTKRLPHRLRDTANRLREKSLKAGSKKKEQTKKSRKARRRHGNLLLEFNRRQRKNVWLETHIWHAKRFIMIKKWGYCLGDRPTSKCYRSCYRAMSNHCLLQDLSYYCCIELQGKESLLLASLSQLTSKDTGPTFAAAVSLSGQRQGSVVVYRAGRYPQQPLGPITFLWRPKTPGSDHRQLWIWAHPTIKQDLLSELQTVCHCCEAVVPSVIPVESPVEVHPALECEEEPKRKMGTKRKQTCKNATEPPAKKLIGDGTRSSSTPVTWKSSSTGTIINDLTMEILRFRLIGPQSLTVLAETLKATDCDGRNRSGPLSLWWSQCCRDQGKRKLHQEQSDIYHVLEGIHVTGHPPAGTVLGLTVDDPRLTLPKRKVKASAHVNPATEAWEEMSRELMLSGVPERCCQSFLWERLVRDNVTDNKLPDQELNRLRSEVLVPGSGLRPTPPQSQVPILLVHQPGKQVGYEQRSWGAGWDLLLPKGWGMAFWVPLVYRGVRIGGLEMSLKHSQISGAPHFPHDYPDCPSGRLFQEEQEKDLRDNFKRHPPAKRTNYIKHGCLAPFSCPWQQLTEEWELISVEDKEGKKRDSQTTATESKRGQTSHQNMAVPTQASSVSVLRNKKSLRLLSDWCGPTSSKGQSLRGIRKAPPLDHSALMLFLQAHRMSLVWVRLSMLSKGRPELHAMVCVPTAEDLQQLSKVPGGPQEPPHKDHFRSRIKARKKASTALLPSESDIMHHSASEPGPITATEPKPSFQSTSDLVCGLWPDPLPSVTSHCSRVTVGWVTQGDFSLSVGRGEALGFVSVAGLLRSLFNQPMEHKGLLLLRNPTSLHYRFVRVNIEV